MHRTIPMLINILKDSTEKERMEWSHPNTVTGRDFDTIMAQLEDFRFVSISELSFFGYPLAYKIRLFDYNNSCTFRKWRWEVNFDKMVSLYKLAEKQIGDNNEIDVSEFVEGLK